MGCLSYNGATGYACFSDLLTVYIPSGQLCSFAGILIVHYIPDKSYARLFTVQLILCFKKMAVFISVKVKECESERINGQPSFVLIINLNSVMKLRSLDHIGWPKHFLLMLMAGTGLCFLKCDC